MKRVRRYGRPHRTDLLAMMLLNALVAAPALLLVFAIFGTRSIFAPILAASPQDDESFIRWLSYFMLLPGAGIMFSCLWYWLILTGRGRGLNWGAALCYGVGIALVNVPVCGFLVGLMLGNPALACIFALICVMLIPHLLLAMSTFGLMMGAFNGLWAHNWIAHHRPKE